MSKRNAAKELNHDNWDQEEESEEAGTFKQVMITSRGYEIASQCWVSEYI
jgi:hypothetical protein